MSTINHSASATDGIWAWTYEVGVAGAHLYATPSNADLMEQAKAKHPNDEAEALIEYLTSLGVQVLIDESYAVKVYEDSGGGDDGCVIVDHPRYEGCPMLRASYYIDADPSDAVLADLGLNRWQINDEADCTVGGKNCDGEPTDLWEVSMTFLVSEDEDEEEEEDAA